MYTAIQPGTGMGWAAVTARARTAEAAPGHFAAGARYTGGPFFAIRLRSL